MKSFPCLVPSFGAARPSISAASLGLDHSKAIAEIASFGLFVQSIKKISKKT